MIRLFLALVLTSVITGCATVKGIFGGSRPENSAHAIDPDNHVEPASTQELELKLARLWAKVDELEQLQRQQQQRVRILEKGLMLGIIPEELKNDAELALKEEPEVRAEPMLIEKPRMQAQPHPEAVDQLTQVAPAQSESVNREEVLREAQGAFEKGRYGQAIALYAKLDQEPGNSQDYWIALCWFRLREYETSHKLFSEFIQLNPSSPWIARAKYNLARVEYELGYRERAVTQMREVISQYPNEDAAQMARASIDSWEQSL